VTSRLHTEEIVPSKKSRIAERLVPILLLLLGLSVFLCEAWEVRAQVDDAYISYRYARNLIEGHGLVFNVGEYVEGFTNLLWTLLVAGGLALGFQADSTGHALGLISSVALLVATYLYACTGLPASRRWIAAIPVFIIVSSISFAEWSVSGMETPMFAAAVTFALAAYARSRLGWATIAVCVATLTRPEGVLIAAILFAFHLASSWRQGWQAWRWPLVFAGLVALLTVFRLVYYGSPLPNTFYAKVGGIPIIAGLRYVSRFLRDGAMWLLFPALIALFGDRRLWPGVAFALLFTGYVIAIGGDAFPHSRFLVPVLPCLAVLGVRGAETAYQANRYLGVAVSLTIPTAVCWHIFGAVPAVILLFTGALAFAWTLAIHFGRIWVVPALALILAAGFVVDYQYGSPARSEGVREHLRSSKRSVRMQRSAYGMAYLGAYAERLAQMLLRERPRPKLVACPGIGAVGYYSRLPILDIFGIIDPTIARSKPEGLIRVRLVPGHHRSNADYVFSRQPDFIMVGKHRRQWSMPALVAIMEHPALAAHYAWDPQIMGYKRKR